MSSRTLYRLSGGVLIVGNLLILLSSVIGAILFPGHSSTREQVLSTSWQLVILMTLLGLLLFVIGLPGMYRRQRERTGILGLIGFILLFFGLLLQGAVFSTLQITVLPWLAQVAPKFLSGNQMPSGAFLLLLVSGLMQMIGTILLGIATMCAHVFPRWVGILLLVSGIAFLLTFGPVLDDLLEVISFFALAVAFIWCRYQLMTREQRPAADTYPTAQLGASR